jgi:predicted GIY-YIG superfamily endonuclease
MVYLLHFERPYFHARHYIGFTNDRIEQRLEEHKKGDGARLMQVITQAGIGFEVARTWEGDRSLERQLKNRKNAARLCPICRAEKKREGRGKDENLLPTNQL